MEKLFFSDALRKFIKPRIFVTDGTTFRLHYRATALLLALCSILVSATQFYGDPIQCIQTDDVPKKLLNTYCWVEGTFTLPKALNKEVGLEVVYPGVAHREPDDDVVFHAYYQWVCFVLLFQAILFYMPRMVWRGWEGGRMRNLLQELNSPILSEDEKRKKFDHLVRYFKSNMHHHSVYAYKYLMCEVINLVNVVAQIFFVDYFLGGEFTTYGISVVSFATGAQDHRVDPMMKIFPRLTKCTFHRYGPSGDVVKYDALCLLPLNIVNEKIYIILWFWFIILAIVTGISILYKVALLTLRRVRYLALHSLARLTSRDQLRTILKVTSFGDWFVLFLLAKNMELANYKDFLTELFRSLKSPLSSTEETDLSGA